MRRNALCVLSSVILLSVGWLGLSGITLLIALIPLLYVSEQYADSKRDWWRMAGWATLTFVLWNISTVWWIWNATPIGPVAATMVSTFWSFIPFMLYHYVVKRAKRSIAYIILVCAWVACEHLYTHTEILSFPWLSMGNGFSGDVWAVQWYEYTGVAGGSLWVLLSNLAIYEYLRQRTKLSSVRAALIVAVPMIVSIVMWWSYEPSQESVQVSVIQPNVDCYEEKFAEDSDESQLANITSLLGEVPSSSRVVVLPETAIPYQLNDREPLAAEPMQMLDSLRDNLFGDALMVSGASTLRIYQDGETIPEVVRQQGGIYYNNFNSAIAFGADGQNVIHHKTRLVVGVEAMPRLLLLEDYVDLGGITGQLGRCYEPTVFSKYDITVGPAICYEGLYGDAYAEFVRRGADIMLVLSNDGWWGNTPGHKRLFDFCRLRAIETRRSVARSANTGVSGFITPRGEVVERLGWDERGVLTADVEVRSEETFYVCYGDWIGRISMLLTLLGMLYYSAYRIRKKNHLVD